jgi:hypothetical protein
VRKINGVFDCELEPTGKCRFDDEQIIGSNIRKCPTGKKKDFGKLNVYLFQVHFVMVIDVVHR